MQWITAVKRAVRGEAERPTKSQPEKVAERGERPEGRCPAVHNLTWLPTSSTLTFSPPASRNLGQSDPKSTESLQGSFAVAVSSAGHDAASVKTVGNGLEILRYLYKA